MPNKMQEVIAKYSATAATIELVHMEEYGDNDPGTVAKLVKRGKIKSMLKSDHSTGYAQVVWFFNKTNISIEDAMKAILVYRGEELDDLDGEDFESLEDIMGGWDYSVGRNKLENI